MPTETASQSLSLEAYLEQMHTWVKRAIAKTSKKGSVMLDREELIQEAQIPLIEVYTKYSDSKTATELGRMGTRAIINHITNLYHKSRKRGLAEAILLPFVEAGDHLEEVRLDAPRTSERNEIIFNPEGLATKVTPLDSMIVRETVESVLAVSDDAREVLSIELGRTRDRSAKLRATALFARSQDIVFSAL